jgi:hypothetical protein
MPIYVLELEHSAYYVGWATDVEKAVDEHREGVEPWTSIHRPIRVAAVLERSASEVDTVVCEWMRRVGMERVRGGSWSGVRLTDEERRAIRLGGERWCVVC